MLRTLALAAILLAPGLHAQTPPDSPAEVSILPGWRDTAGHHMAAIRVDLAPGWKTYWRAPGDAGIPPHWQWTRLDNVAAVAFHWPVPEVSHQGGMRSIGYSSELILPMQITPTDPGLPIHLAGSVQIGVCETICLPMEFQFDIRLMPGGTRDGVIMAALLDRPRSAAEAGVGAVTCAASAMEGGLELTATVDLALGSGDAVVIETADPAVWVSEPVVTATGGSFVATSRLYSNSGDAIGLDRSGVRITVIGAGHAVDIRGCSAG